MNHSRESETLTKTIIIDMSRVNKLKDRKIIKTLDRLIRKNYLKANQRYLNHTVDYLSFPIDYFNFPAEGKIFDSLLKTSDC